MVLSLAVDSVEKKLQMQASVLVGNYEFYYAVGKMTQYLQLPVDGKMSPLMIKEVLERELPNFTPPSDDAKGQYLIRLLERYRPSEKYDEQMEQLFLWGKTGEAQN